MSLTLVVGDPPYQGGVAYVTVDPNETYVEVGFPQVGDPGTGTPYIRVSPLVTVGAVMGIAQAIIGASGVKPPVG